MHEAIRADPLAQKKERSTPDEKKKWKATKLTYDERKAALKARAPFPAPAVEAAMNLSIQSWSKQFTVTIAVELVLQWGCEILLAALSGLSYAEVWK